MLYSIVYNEDHTIYFVLEFLRKNLFLKTLCYKYETLWNGFLCITWKWFGFLHDFKILMGNLISIELARIEYNKIYA